MTGGRPGLMAAARQRLLLGWLDAAQNSLSEPRARVLVSALQPPANAAPARRRQLLVDVSVISRGDAGTGIQRVVRALLLQLLKAPPPGFDVRPIESSRWHRYRHAPASFSAGLGQAAGFASGRRLEAGPGDVYLGLDLATYDVIRRYRQFNRWKMAGVKFVFVVHDLLPASHPEWFSRKAVQAFRGWIRNVAIYADGALCVSRAVRDELSI